MSYDSRLGDACAACGGYHHPQQSCDEAKKVTVDQAIGRSLRTNKTVFVEYEEELEGELLRLCKDSFTNQDGKLYWGIGERNEWRVFMKKFKGIQENE